MKGETKTNWIAVEICEKEKIIKRKKKKDTGQYDLQEFRNKYFWRSSESVFVGQAISLMGRRVGQSWCVSAIRFGVMGMFGMKRRQMFGIDE